MVKVTITCVLISLACMTILFMWYITTAYDLKTHTEFSIVSPSNSTVTKPLKSHANLLDLDVKRSQEKLFRERKKHLTERCNSPQVSSYLTANRPVTKAFFYSSEAKLVVCKVPKIGSTFWARIFNALEGEISVRKAFLLDRYEVHDGKYEIGFVFSKEAKKRGSKIGVVSRNPYSRLFSAYIDKIYLLSDLNQKFGRRLKKGLEDAGDGKCGFSVTFQDFLETLLNSAHDGGQFDDHYAPVTRLCNPCHLNIDYVIKQETMSSDAEFVLDIVKKERNISHIEDIKMLIRHMDMRQELRQLIKTILKDRKKFIVECPEISSLMQKVWTVLQFQGIIHYDSEYPIQTFRDIKKSKSYENEIITIIMREIERKPVSLTQRKYQRQDAVMHAFRGVTEYNIGRIKMLYKLDFLLFGYDLEPPL
ncbi:carbohydrate sulfotransferase 13-like [Ylistrum balloti]|uniref:carbohydrate sulfotransferase 13-like n=1 Tax=Ylistrum balloti TaxID=509963 RepID=UPI002905ED26|nr:carbohydrate sulfotransferase 13-like [Ylistrum balloti]